MTLRTGIVTLVLTAAADLIGFRIGQDHAHRSAAADNGPVYAVPLGKRRCRVVGGGANVNERRLEAEQEG
ncbi:MAG TPA: hypothetical protein VHS27_12820 [Gaiellales bacterium]|jgi:hypothetical protein|nr:hypothetical protein [Gaiellales bacterium]